MFHYLLNSLLFLKTLLFSISKMPYNIVSYIYGNPYKWFVEDPIFTILRITRCIVH